MSELNSKTCLHSKKLLLVRLLNKRKTAKGYKLFVSLIVIICLQKKDRGKMLKLQVELCLS